MKDLQEKLQKLLADAEDCNLISNLASDVAKRATFRRLAAQFREMAEEVKAAIAARTSDVAETRSSDAVGSAHPQ